MQSMLLLHLGNPEPLPSQLRGLERILNQSAQTQLSSATAPAAFGEIKVEFCNDDFSFDADVQLCDKAFPSDPTPVCRTVTHVKQHKCSESIRMYPDSSPSFMVINPSDNRGICFYNLQNALRDNIPFPSRFPLADWGWNPCPLLTPVLLSIFAHNALPYDTWIHVCKEKDCKQKSVTSLQQGETKKVHIREGDMKLVLLGLNPMEGMCDVDISMDSIQWKFDDKYQWELPVWQGGFAQCTNLQWTDAWQKLLLYNVLLYPTVAVGTSALVAHCIYRLHGARAARAVALAAAPAAAPAAPAAAPVAEPAAPETAAAGTFDSTGTLAPTGTNPSSGAVELQAPLLDQPQQI